MLGRVENTFIDEIRFANRPFADWNKTEKKSKLLEVFSKFDPDVVALLDKVEEDTLKVWELLDMEPLPTWVNEKLALLGDAAHPYLPRKSSYSTLRYLKDWQLMIHVYRPGPRCWPSHGRCSGSCRCPAPGD